MVRQTELMEKPDYRVLSMAEIATIPWNGLTVASTFSGGGGSCTGYRMAGCRVRWANEWLPAAQETYRANHPDSILDGRSIRDIKADDIFKALGIKTGELDIFDGSPPCQSFSTAGQRERGWAKERDYGHGLKQRNDDLFNEYGRLLIELRPKAFIAENVSGLVKGTAKGYFKEILRMLRSCGYVVEAKLLDAQWLGVPQMRQRIIFMGFRKGLNLNPVFPSPLPYRYSVREAINDIESLHGHGFSKGLEQISLEHPAPTIMATGAAQQRMEVQEQSKSERRKLTIAELKRLCSFPDDYILTGSYADQWERLGNAVPPVMMYHIAAAVRDRLTRPERVAA